MNEEVIVTLDGKKLSESCTPSKHGIISLLYDFIDRVSKGKATSETEIAVLPEVASRLFEMID